MLSSLTAPHSGGSVVTVRKTVTAGKRVTSVKGAKKAPTPKAGNAKTTKRIRGLYVREEPDIEEIAEAEDVDAAPAADSPRALHARNLCSACPAGATLSKKGFFERNVPSGVTYCGLGTGPEPSRFGRMADGQPTNDLTF